MKNVSRNKFLLCFRPVDEVMLDSESAVKRSQNPSSLTIVGIKSRKGEMKKPRSKSSSSSTTSADNSLILHPPRKTSFSRAIKAVLFEIILSKRVRDGRSLSEDLYESKHSSSSFNKNEEIKSNIESSSSSSSSSSLISEPNSKKNNIIRPNEEKKDMGIYLVLFSLTVTIFWGKLCAIIFISVWLYFLGRL
ncbi:hypothetical protein JCGZ_19749 [Jatropha curcas]|uniref:Uncharacterized protein n=1 Tax=Jatropha curcas TaxID=180498 RepID=A0A067L863_JATCU|nr:uncharacterized protein LOC105650272 [Jatropha curcas]KDP44607.1 hypothetical protein JCGZ_19749 [Jatropha curcas]